MKKKSTIEQLKKAIGVLQSPHIKEVQVALEYEAGDVRYYTAITHKGFEQHRYTVRAWNGFDESRNEPILEMKCDCPAGKYGQKCRHALKVMEKEVESFNRPIVLSAFDSYSAHLRARRVA